MILEFPVPYDPEFQSPIPTIWRDTIILIVDAFKDKDFARLNTIPNVELIDLEYASELVEYIVDYGVHLISLPKDTWNTSVCLYMEDEFWKAIIDLFTAEEGCSDLILDLHIFKKQNQFEFQINGIYVP
ncbi:hypothetical protein [Acinetobacter guillouiae]|uniref:DUF7668 domain-containing protein n=1 Tax=Acinetobacter guillouiae TaxID=106649 RepID=UPI00125F74C1|nr:hypothetical protein [Acinetobacter guillouiae]